MPVPELSDIINRNVEQYAFELLNTCMPAKVTSVEFYQEKQVISVIPVIRDVYKDLVEVELPEILDVPVVFPTGGGGIITFPLKKDDIVLLLFGQRSMFEWLESSGTEVTTPGDRRNHAYADAIALPGIFTRTNNLTPNPDHVEIKFKGSSVRLEDNGDIVLSSVGNIQMSAMQDVNITAVGDVNVNGSTINLN